ncbi:hypothetical protein ABXJ76_10895 [Methylobacter sp. G7]|uniref:hypothetical protein n=1 Tax=Methylobacter sp. G7 TaxID=3230117 RepID=UPI003D809173
MMHVKSLVIHRSLVLLVIASLISGCAVPFLGGYGADGQSLEAFEHHAEEIFRLQNRMTSEVMILLLLESEDAKKHQALMQAEHHMQQTCADLNEYVSRDIDGLSSGFLLRRRVEKSALDCEQAALELKALLAP